MEDFQGRKVLVLGLGKSGYAAATELAKAGASVLVVDQETSESLKERAGTLESFGAQVRLGAHQLSDLQGIELLIASPGIPGHHFLITEAHRRHVPVWSEIELAFQLNNIPSPVVAVTGTNGKTTTVRILGEIFREAGRVAIVAGNIGFPLLEATASLNGAQVIIAEISSFQLEHTYKFRPHIALLLNLSEDHLDWHGDYGDYLEAKRRLFLNQTPDDWAVVNGDDQQVLSLMRSVRSKVFPFSRRPRKHGAYVKKGQIMLKLKDGAAEVPVISVGDLRIKGRHNVENALAAAAGAWLSGVSPKAIGAGLAKFPGLPHRLEYVATVRGASYYNDSKATNPGATISALNSFEEPVILLAGGRNKGNSFNPLVAEVAKKARMVMVFGEARDELANAIGAATTVVAGTTLQGAVGLASERARAGDVVLLSPACASFDQFADYEERGDQFKEAVSALADHE